MEGRLVGLADILSLASTNILSIVSPSISKEENGLHLFDSGKECEPALRRKNGSYLKAHLQMYDTTCNCK